MPISRIPQRCAWWLLIATVVCLTSCGGSTLTPADATVTAIVGQAVDQSKCTPALTTSLSSTMLATTVTLAQLGDTTATFIGTCWKPGTQVTLGVLDHAAPSGLAANGTIVPLLQNNTRIILQVQPNGSFQTDVPLTDALTNDVWDAQLPFVAFAAGYTQFAATSIPVTNT
jgi:hypothetical protein